MMAKSFTYLHFDTYTRNTHAASVSFDAGSENDDKNTQMRNEQHQLSPSQLIKLVWLLAADERKCNGKLCSWRHFDVGHVLLRRTEEDAGIFHVDGLDYYISFLAGDQSRSYNVTRG